MPGYRALVACGGPAFSSPCQGREVFRALADRMAELPELNVQMFFDVQPRPLLASFIEVGTGGRLRRSTRGPMMMRGLFFTRQTRVRFRRHHGLPGI